MVRLTLALLATLVLSSFAAPDVQAVGHRGHDSGCAGEHHGFFHGEWRLLPFRANRLARRAARREARQSRWAGHHGGCGAPAASCAEPAAASCSQPAYEPAAVEEAAVEVEVCPGGVCPKS